MINTPSVLMQPVQGNIIPPQTTVQNSTQNDMRKTALKEQSMVISYNIAAEYSAISRMSEILANIAKEIKSEEDSQRKKTLETRLNNLNNMILQREFRINQMEQLKARIDSQII